MTRDDAQAILDDAITIVICIGCIPVLLWWAVKDAVWSRWDHLTGRRDPWGM